MKSQMNQLTQLIKKLILALFCTILCGLCGCTLLSDNSSESSDNNSNDYDKITSIDYAMGTVINQTIYVNDNNSDNSSTGAVICNDILREIERLEKDILSVRYPNSEISKMNSAQSEQKESEQKETASEESEQKETASEESGRKEIIPEESEQEKPDAAEEFNKYLAQANDLAKNSSYAFDPAIGKLIRLWDIDGENPHKPKDSEIKKLLSGSKTGSQSGSYPTEKSYDLGAIGKGIACDRAERILSSNNSSEIITNNTENERDPESKTDNEQPLIKGAIIAVGGSIVVHGQKPDGKPWEIAVTNPRKGDDRHPVDGNEYTQEDYLGKITIPANDKIKNHPIYISTSGDYEKYFEQDGIRYHHILNPATGYPADSGLISVTIICEDHSPDDGLPNNGKPSDNLPSDGLPNNGKPSDNLPSDGLPNNGKPSDNLPSDALPNNDQPGAGLLSDGLSTACFVLGIEKSLPLLDHYNAKAIFVDKDRCYYTYNINDKNKTKEDVLSFTLTAGGYTEKTIQQ